MNKKKISIYTPCFNEEDNIEYCYSTIKDLFKNDLKDYDYEHIFGDNCSEDIKKVDLSIPIYFLPYIDFSTQTPKRLHISPDKSEANIIFKLCFKINLSCLTTLSLETPITEILFFKKKLLSLENSIASLVHPGVSSLG